MLPEGFAAILTSSVGIEAANRFISAMGEPASVSIRLNPFKTPNCALPFLESSVEVPWNTYGRILGERPVFTLDPLFHAGAYYVQDSSAMFPGWLFRKCLDEVGSSPDGYAKVLDLCAAPGGKTTDLAASLRKRFGDNFILVSNEVMKKRASVLSDNVALWGDPNVMVTSVDPKAFASIGGFFDIIVADVPCSGEGMFRKDEKAVRDWSVETVGMCAARQRRIIADVWPALKTGGVLVYSTCTFADEENDGNVKWIASELGADIIAPLQVGFDGVVGTSCGFLLIPGSIRGEGQYCAALSKTSGQAVSGKGLQHLSCLHPLRFGVRHGERKGKDMVPDPDWALSIKYECGSYPEVEVDRMTALHFLHRDTICLENAVLGYNLLKYCGVALGFVKNIGKRCNNLHPQGRRILMDIDK